MEARSRELHRIGRGAGTSLREVAVVPRARLLVGLTAALLAVAGAAYLLHAAVERALHHIIAEHLAAVLDTHLAALEVWLENERTNVAGRAREPTLAGAIATLAARSRDGAPPAELLASPASLTVEGELAPMRAAGDYLGFAVLDHSGRVIAASGRGLVGSQLTPAGTGLLAQALGGVPLVSRPLRPAALWRNGDAGTDRPFMLAMAPVRDRGGTVVAGLSLWIDPDKDFTRLLSVGRLGDSGETYAFDARGMLLSNTRHAGQLAELGLLPRAADGSAVLRLVLRDPGGDLTRGFRPPARPEERPLTRMAAAAVTGWSGHDVDGYRDHRGITVVGAWRWLPAYGFGVATEVDRAEAYAPLRPIALGAVGLSGALVLAVAAAGGGGLMARRLRHQVKLATQLGQYTLGRELGAGGLGVVYEARHALLRRPAAVKVLRPEVTDEETVRRFEREVQLTGQLTHPSSIAIYDYGRTRDGIFYYVMELLPGITLARLLELAGRVEPARTIHVLRQVCASLREAHGIGLVHRDIKPLNIMINVLGAEYDVVKVLDFGLVKELPRSGEPELAATQGLTGTPAYVAPERLRDPSLLDVRSDLYAVGVVGFNLLTGEDLFPGASALELAHQALATPAPRASERLAGTVPAALDDLLLRCLAKRPEDRPTSAEELLAALEALALDHPWPREAAKAWWERHPELGTASRGEARLAA